MKYEFRVHPGAPASAIRLAYAGADGLAVATTAASRSRPRSARCRTPRRSPTRSSTAGACRWRAATTSVARGQFGFRLGAYQADRDLVIDPGIQFTTFLGGIGHEIGNGIVSDAAGNSYIAGTTQSPDFPTTSARSAARARPTTRTSSSPS